MVLLLMCLCCSGCQNDTDTLRIFAASSLQDAAPSLRRAYLKHHPNQRVSFVFSGSQVLRLQLEQGAQADIFMTANSAHMQALVKKKLVMESQPFAQNRLAIITPVSSAHQNYLDLKHAQRLVIGSPHSPIGQYTRRFLARVDTLRPGFQKQVMRRVVSQENNVRLVRAKVLLGEADMAIVYATDVWGQPGLKVLAMEQSMNTRALYEVGRLKKTPRALSWQAFLRSKDAINILTRHGFDAL